LEEHLVPQTTDVGLRARAFAEQAIAAALEADWPRAVDLNQKILETAPDDVDARNRLGRALLEQGRLDEAKAAFTEVLKTEPYNSIALRGNQRVTTLQEHKTKPATTSTKTQPRLFIEDMGKTGILRLINPAPQHVLAKYSPGAECELREQEGLLALHARDGELVGFLEPKVGRRLIDLLRTGNQYVAALVSTDAANPRVAIREIAQSPENASRISFPGHHRPAETKERAYVRGTFFRYGGADDDVEAEEVEEAEEEAPTGEEVLEEAESTDEPIAVDTEEDDDTEDEAEE
jgi:tetratricopeptide (TPR) repeat protein